MTINIVISDNVNPDVSTSVNINLLVNEAPIANDVLIGTISTFEETLLANGTYNYSDNEQDNEGTTTFKWFYTIGINGGLIEIQGLNPTNQNLRIINPCPEMQTCYLIFEVTPVAETGTLIGTPTKSPRVAFSGMM